MYDQDKIIAFIGVIHFPHPKNKKIKKVTRMVVLPDYQGIGIGVAFLNEVAQMYSQFDFRITTSAKNLICALNKNKQWKFESFERTKLSKTGMAAMQTSKRTNTKTASFRYIKIP